MHTLLYAESNLSYTSRASALYIAFNCIVQTDVYAQ